MDTLVGVLGQALPAAIGLLAATAALGRRLAGIGVLRATDRFPHPGVPRLWGVAWGSLLFLVLVLGLGASRTANPRVLIALAVFGTVPFAFARANVFLLMRRKRGRIDPGSDWVAARRGEFLGFAAIGLFAAQALSPTVRRAEAVAAVSVLAGLVLIAAWRRETANAATPRPHGPGVRSLMGSAITLVGGTTWIFWPDRLPHGLGVALVGAATGVVAGYLLIPACRPLRQALEADRRGMTRSIADAAALLLAIAAAGGVVAWAFDSFGLRPVAASLLCGVVVIGAVDVVVHRQLVGSGAS